MHYFRVSFDSACIHSCMTVTVSNEHTWVMANLARSTRMPSITTVAAGHSRSLFYSQLEVLTDLYRQISLHPHHPSVLSARSVAPLPLGTTCDRMKRSSSCVRRLSTTRIHRYILDPTLGDLMYTRARHSLNLYIM